ncbi:MAG: hypothetical protein JXA11_02840 [Phycisphaerae bacterium]|nr:hypothetical protein [Phycisphaerae bacterium]
MQRDDIQQNDIEAPEQENTVENHDLEDLQVAMQIPVSSGAKEGVKRSFQKKAGINWLAVFGLILGIASAVLYFHVHILLAYFSVLVGIITSVLGLQSAQQTRSGIKLAISATATCLVIAGLIIIFTIRIAYG